MDREAESAAMRREAFILDLWQAIARQDAHELARFFTVDARILWPNSGERFDLPGYLRANCDYPGQWSGQVERIAEDGSYSVARVWSAEGLGLPGGDVLSVEKREDPSDDGILGRDRSGARLAERTVPFVRE